MKKHLKKFVALVLLIATSFLVVTNQKPVQTEAISQSEIDAAKKEQEKIKQQREEYQKKLQQLNADVTNAKQYIRELDSIIAGITEKIYDLESQMSEKETQIADIEVKLEKAKQDEVEQYEAMKLRIQYMYEHGNATYMDVLFNAQSFSELLNKAEYLSKITEYDRKMLEKLQNTKNEIAATEAQLKSEYAQLEELQSQNRIELASNEYLLASKNSEVERLNSMVSDSESELKEIIRQEDELDAEVEAMIKKLQAQIAAEEAKKKLEQINQGGYFHWPVPGYYRITSVFSLNRLHPVLGVVRKHNGVDIGVPTGVKIQAAAEGTVVISQYSVSAGNYIVIDHGGGVMTEYMHCSKLIARVGQKVKQDEVIGLVGSTGYSTGPHLHFGVRTVDGYVDPLSFFSNISVK
ncbi:MAG: peptidoglycan DD-metalloendopeptidase family protein [Lachnospiraceae bacterium]|nr:peptidoglycan DD-metalloendopeptidase family protein [Lachnospiraceae bacterium]